MSHFVAQAIMALPTSGVGSWSMPVTSLSRKLANQQQSSGNISESDTIIDQ